MMQHNEKFKDWLFRYQYVYRVRRTEKQKRRFLTALVTDISELRQDVKVIEYDRQKKYASRNVYVGNLEAADRVICTYYDTPPQAIGPYVLFDRKVQGRGTMGFIIGSSMLMLLLGGLGTFAYMRGAANELDFTSVYTWFFAVLFGVYFFLLVKVAQVVCSRNTLVRYTSSILTLLRLLGETRDPKTAYAFIDEGSYGEKGLAAVRSSMKKGTKLIYLDSVGGAAPLHILGTGLSKKKNREGFVEHTDGTAGITYIFSAQTRETAGQHTFFLTPQDLGRKRLDEDNMNQVLDLLR